MSCSNCFNGCADIISDECVKYTGVPIPELGILTGDTLLTVENKITSKLVDVMKGTGIIPIIAPADICAIVQSFLPHPCCPPFTLNDVLTAVIKSICDINTRLDALKDRVIVVEDAIVALNSTYTTSCLVGVDGTSKTHEVVQAIITKLCALETQLTLYVTKAELPTLIAAYLASLPASTLVNTKMVPFISYPYFGDISTNFGPTGAGLNTWAKINICNGQNGTPDLRGVTLVGATIGTGMDTKVAPGGANPNYVVNSVTPAVYGDNQVFLTSVDQLFPHTHTATFSSPPHTHNIPVKGGQNDGSTGKDYVDPTYEFGTPLTIIPESIAVTGTVIVGTTGSATVGIPTHQPSKAANYIMYIP